MCLRPTPDLTGELAALSRPSRWICGRGMGKEGIERARGEKGTEVGRREG